MTWDAVIFDCDGTLVDSEDLANEILVEYVGRFGITLTIEEALTRFRGIKMTECVMQLEALRGEPLPARFVPGLRQCIADAFTSRLRAIDGAFDLLNGLNVPYCVASGGPRDKIELSLSLTGLLAHFDGRIYSSYDVGSWKPDPGLFLHAAREMGVDPERCAVVEDSVPGIVAGLAAGMTVFALQLGVPDPRIPERAQIITHLRELHGLFREARIAV